MTAPPRVTSRTCACRLEMPERETDRRKAVFTFVTAAVCTARCNRNTIKMILLPSHITCCAGFCINVLRIKNSMLQSYNKHIHTACHSQTCYNFYYSVICIITVASKASTSAYFFPLLRASSYFYTTKTDVDSYDASFPYLVSYANVCSHISVLTCTT